MSAPIASHFTSLTTPREASRAWLALALIAGALLPVFGCSAKADKAACEKMTEHDYGILDERNSMSGSPAGKKLLDELKAKSIEGCIGKMTMSQIECHMKAPTPADMSKCDPED